MRIPLPAVLLFGFAACSSNGDETQAKIVANTMSVASPDAGADVAPVPPQDASVPPKPGESKTFRDWIVACDNVRRCAMASLAPETGDAPTVTMALARDAGPAGGYTVSFGHHDAGAPVPAMLIVDGAQFPVTGDDVSGAPAARIAAALAKAAHVAVRDAEGATIATLAAAGAAASLRYVDAVQGRAGGVTATVAKGAMPAGAVPAAPAPPVVVALRPTGTAATPTIAQLVTMKKIGRCEDAPSPGADWSPAAHALGGGKTLVVLPCSAGAYNVIGALFVIDGGGKVTPADVDAPVGFDVTGADSQTPVHSIVNGDWKAGLLTSDAMGRGLGDCGVNQSLAWDGTRLRLVEQAEMGECRGNTDFLRTWTATVVRR